MTCSLSVIMLFAAIAEVPREVWVGQGRHTSVDISGVLALTSPPLALHHFARQLIMDLNAHCYKARGWTRNVESLSILNFYCLSIVHSCLSNWSLRNYRAIRQVRGEQLCIHFNRCRNPCAKLVCQEWGQNQASRSFLPQRSVECLLSAYIALAAGDTAANKTAKIPYGTYILVMGNTRNKTNQ